MTSQSASLFDNPLPCCLLKPAVSRSFKPHSAFERRSWQSQPDPQQSATERSRNSYGTVPAVEGDGDAEEGEMRFDASSGGCDSHWYRGHVFQWGNYKPVSRWLAGFQPGLGELAAGTAPSANLVLGRTALQSTAAMHQRQISSTHAMK